MAAFFGITEAPGWGPPDEDEDLPPVDADNCYEVWPENMESYQLFGHFATQWKLDANNTPFGIDYRTIQAHLEWVVDDVARRRELYEDLCVMERAASEVFVKNAADAIEAVKRQAK